MSAATQTTPTELPDDLNHWLIGKGINILVAGKTGVGKSTLVNSLMGEKIAPEGNDLQPETMEVISYKAQINGIDVVIWDSPGLQDGAQKENKYIEEMKRKCESYDLVLYCTSMFDTRFPTDDDLKAIKGLTYHFGQKIWNNAVYVLTFANEVKRDPLKKFRNLKQAIPIVMTEQCDVEKVAARSIPIVAAGYIDEDGTGRALPPITSDWLSTLWYTAILEMKQRAQPAMLVANIDRIARTEYEASSVVRETQGSRHHIAPLNDPSIQEAAPIFKLIAMLQKTFTSDTFHKCKSVGHLLGSSFGGITGGLIGTAAGGAIGATIDLVAEYFKCKENS